MDGFDTGGNTVEIKGIYEKDKSTLWVIATLLGPCGVESRTYWE